VAFSSPSPGALQMISLLRRTIESMKTIPFAAPAFSVSTFSPYPYPLPLFRPSFGSSISCNLQGINCLRFQPVN
jgi:hypothetical protein